MPGKPQTLTKGQEEVVVGILRRKLLTWIVSFCTIFACVVGVSLVGIWQSVKHKMEDLVARQFEEPQIRLVVREAAAERASALMTEQVAPDVTRFKAEVSKALDETMKKVTSTVAELESVSEFMNTVLAAQNDDRKAFDKLETWSKDKAHPFRDRAQQAWTAILESHSQPFFISELEVPWSKGVDPSKLSLEELAKTYQSASPSVKRAVIQYVWEREDIAKIERLDFLMAVMQHDESLMAVEYAGRYFTLGTDQKIKPLAVEFLSKWWKEHRHEFKGK